MSLNLRKRKHINYYEPEEPNFDEYLYCDLCSDFVYDHCSIHGPLLVVPDNKVPDKTNFPSYVPRAALTIPHVFLHLAPSIIPGAGLGVFSSLTLPRGVRFGPYRGQRTQNVDSMYCWQINCSNNKRSYVLDAADSDRSNWMRYVNCSRHWKEQNLLAYQYKGQLYYRTIKIIPRYTELMVFYGSEFANVLHINLSKYNSANYYKDIISTSTKTLVEKKKEKKDNDIQEEYLTAEYFNFISENSAKDNSSKNSSDKDINSNVFLFSEINKPNNSISRKNDNSFPKTIALSKNEIKQDTDCKKNTSKPRHECEICKKTYLTTKSLKVHVLLHLDIRKFNCDYCLYRTNQYIRFKQHVGKHTDTYQFSCEICPYKTNYRRSIDNHCCTRPVKNGRRKSRNYFPVTKSCTLCKFNTISRKSFATHMAQHRGNIYKCDSCSYSNHTKYNLSRHIKSNHC